MIPLKLFSEILAVIFSLSLVFQRSVREISLNSGVISYSIDRTCLVDSV
jgi:hypothetical protein